MSFVYVRCLCDKHLQEREALLCTEPHYPHFLSLKFHLFLSIFAHERKTKKNILYRWYASVEKKVLCYVKQMHFECSYKSCVIQSLVQNWFLYILNNKIVARKNSMGIFQWIHWEHTHINIHSVSVEFANIHFQYYANVIKFIGATHPLSASQ